MINGAITTTEAARRLGVTSSRVRQLVLAGDLPAQKIGNTLLINIRDLAKYQRQKSVKAA